jgi:hypothetical protein
MRQRLVENRPQFVVMYGMKGKPHFECLAGRKLQVDQIVLSGPTMMVLTKHPVAFGSSKAHWEALGRQLRS